jgi:hypothetical protein
MRLYVGFTVFQTLVDPADINRARAKFGEKMQGMQQAGKIDSGGVFAGRRQGYMVLNADSEDEAFTLLAELADFCEMETYPLASFDTLGKYLAENPLS